MPLGECLRHQLVGEYRPVAAAPPAVAITNSTGKFPPPGNGGGVNGITRMPGIFDSGPVDSTSSCCAVFLRSLHGFVTMPPKPPVGDVIWKMLSLSGNE